MANGRRIRRSIRRSGVGRATLERENAALRAMLDQRMQAEHMAAEEAARRDRLRAGGLVVP